MAIDMSDYVDVAERIRIFAKKYPEGSLRPLNPDRPYEVIQVGDRTFIAYTAAAFRNPTDPCPGVGTAWEPIPGRTPYTRDSELMNAETSAWGRAIVACLVADTKRIASADEVRARSDEGAPIPFPKIRPVDDEERHPSAHLSKTSRSREEMIADANAKSDAMRNKNAQVGITASQVGLIKKLARERNITDIVATAREVLGDHSVAALDHLNKKQGSDLITHLMNGAKK